MTTKLFYINAWTWLWEKLIKGKGRILVRKSGTESKIRVMGESENKALLFKCVNMITKKIK